MRWPNYWTDHRGLGFLCLLPRRVWHSWRQDQDFLGPCWLAAPGQCVIAESGEAEVTDANWPEAERSQSPSLPLGYRLCSQPCPRHLNALVLLSANIYRTTEDEVVEWHYHLNGHKLE